MDLEIVHSIRQPAAGRAGELGSRGLCNPAQPHLVEIGPAGENLALRQDVRLPSESTDPLDSPDEAGPVLCFHPAQLRGSRPARQQAL